MKKLLIILFLFPVFAMAQSKVSIKDSCDKYHEISRFVEAKNDSLFVLYFDKEKYWLAKADSITAIADRKKDSVLKINLEKKYKIKLP